MQDSCLTCLLGLGLLSASAQLEHTLACARHEVSCILFVCSTASARRSTNQVQMAVALGSGFCHFTMFHKLNTLLACRPTQTHRSPYPASIPPRLMCVRACMCASPSYSIHADDPLGEGPCLVYRHAVPTPAHQDFCTRFEKPRRLSASFVVCLSPTPDTCMSRGHSALQGGNLGHQCPPFLGNECREAGSSCAYTLWHCQSSAYTA